MFVFLTPWPPLTLHPEEKTRTWQNMKHKIHLKATILYLESLPLSWTAQLAALVLLESLPSFRP